MVALDSPLLKADPAKIAFGGGQPPGGDAATAPGRENPACHAALAGYRIALMFSVLFTGLVFVVSLTAAAALVYAIIKIIDDGLDLAAAVAGVSGVVGSGAAVYLGKRMNEARKHAREALGDVSTHCGSQVKEQVQ